ncbi:hypothetical protein H6F51_21445 [Cyanobacteria bacterium FACHB-DQ100]|nr:hypothetical protein [Cyanobacteria bacterium FACHB-DQ100]
MATLCQISLVDDEARFFAFLLKNNVPGEASGYGKFYGEVPEIGSTLQINWNEIDIEKFTATAGGELDTDFMERCLNDADEYLKVIHVHRYFVPTPELFAKSYKDMKRGLTIGHFQVTECTVFVVKARL